MGADDRKVGKTLQHLLQALGVGVIIAVIPRVQQHRQSLFFALLVDPHAADVIRLYLLYVVVQLHSFKAQAAYRLHLAPDIGAFGMNRTQPGHGAPAFLNRTGDKGIDALGLVRRCRHGKDNEMVDPMGLPQRAQRTNAAVIDKGQPIKA